jgi:hypothetical protein
MAKLELDGDSKRIRFSRRKHPHDLLAIISALAIRFGTKIAGSKKAAVLFCS